MANLDLAIEDGELMVLVGPSGCGKTTALRMVAGLEEITEGDLRIGDRIVNDLTPKERNIAMVFQSYALYPHMTVEDNLAFSLKLHKMPKREVKERVLRAANILQIEEFLKRKPRALSGGQRQRVAMGRAIVREPEAFLMDEPLSNLDAKLRVQMRAEIHQLQRRLDVTTIYVTHDQTEAMTMGDKVAVMNRGVLQQVDSPQEMYDRPENLFVAGFIGSPAMNMVEAVLARVEAGCFAEFAGLRLRVPDETLAARPALAGYVGKSIVLGIRPEDMEDPQFLPTQVADAQIPVVVAHREAMGAEVYAHFTVDARPVLTEHTRDLAADTGGDLADHERAESTTFVARLHPRTSAARGRPITLQVDTRSLHFFDPATSQAIA